jgi:hypothetical protein
MADVGSVVKVWLVDGEHGATLVEDGEGGMAVMVKQRVAELKGTDEKRREKEEIGGNFTFS